eukprot:1177957-Prorocentrum_minimum.AAC.3
MLSTLTRLAPPLRGAAALCVTLYPHTIGSCSRYMLSTLARLAAPLRSAAALCVTLYPHTIGSCSGYMLSTLARLAPPLRSAAALHVRRTARRVAIPNYGAAGSQQYPI